jgi:hypothetical protein
MTHYKHKSAMGHTTLASHSTALTKGKIPGSVQHSPKVGRDFNLTSYRFGSLGSGMKVD